MDFLTLLKYTRKIHALHLGFIKNICFFFIICFQLHKFDKFIERKQIYIFILFDICYLNKSENNTFPK